MTAYVMADNGVTSDHCYANGRTPLSSKRFDDRQLLPGLAVSVLSSEGVAHQLARTTTPALNNLRDPNRRNRSARPPPAVLADPVTSARTHPSCEALVVMSIYLTRPDAFGITPIQSQSVGDTCPRRAPPSPHH
jgi:hypothetical protein